MYYFKLTVSAYNGARYFFSNLRPYSSILVKINESKQKMCNLFYLLQKNDEICGLLINPVDMIKIIINNNEYFKKIINFFKEKINFENNKKNNKFMVDKFQKMIIIEKDIYISLIFLRSSDSTVLKDTLQKLNVESLKYIEFKNLEDIYIFKINMKYEKYDDMKDIIGTCENEWSLNSKFKELVNNFFLINGESKKIVLDCFNMQNDYNVFLKIKIISNCDVLEFKNEIFSEENLIHPMEEGFTRDFKNNLDPIKQRIYLKDYLEKLKEDKEIVYLKNRETRKEDIYDFQSIKSFDKLHFSFSLTRFIFHFLINSFKIILKQKESYKENYEKFIKILEENLKFKENFDIKQEEKNTTSKKFQILISNDLNLKILNFKNDNLSQDNDFNILLKKIFNNYEEFINNISNLFGLFNSHFNFNEKDFLLFCDYSEKIFNFIYSFKELAKYYNDYIFFFPKILLTTFLFKNFFNMDLSSNELNHKILKFTFKYHTTGFSKIKKIPLLEIKLLKDEKKKIIIDEFANSILNCFIFLQKNYNKIDEKSIEDLNNIKLINFKEIELKKKEVNVFFQNEIFEEISIQKINFDQKNKEKVDTHLKELLCLNNKFLKYNFKKEKICLKQENENLKLPNDLSANLAFYQNLILVQLWKKNYLEKENLKFIISTYMGSGKTIIGSVFLLLNFHTNKEPTLIITIKSLLYNWFYEIEKIEKKYNLIKLKKKVLKSDEKENKIKKVIKEFNNNFYDVLILTPTVYKNINLLNIEINFNLLIIDEINEIKYFDEFCKLKKKKIALGGCLFDNKIKNFINFLEFIGFNSKENEIISNIDNTFLKVADNKFNIEIIKNFFSNILQNISENIFFMKKEFFFNFLKNKNNISINEYHILLSMNSEQSKIYENYYKNIEGLTQEVDIQYLNISEDLYKSFKDINYEYNFIPSPMISIIIDIIKNSLENKKNILILASLLDTLTYIRLFLILNLKKLQIEERDIQIFNGSIFESEKSRFDFFKNFNKIKRSSILLFSSSMAVGINLSNIGTIIETGLYYFIKFKLILKNRLKLEPQH
jgi:hypothetical protein